jgi:hypothetical protein
MRMRKRIIEAICFLLFIALLGTANYNRAEAATKAEVFQNSSVKNVRISDISRNQVRLEWNGLRYANGYLIKRSKSLNGKYKTIVSWAVNYCIDNTIEEGETYYYKIYGEIYSNQKLQYSSKPVIFKVSPVPDKPKVSIKIVDNQVTFTIQKINNVDGYRIFMASSEDGEYKAIKTIKEGKSLTYTKTGLDYGKTYYFRICAFAIQHDEGYDGTYNEKKVIIDSKYSSVEEQQETPASAFEYEIKKEKVTITKFTDKMVETVVIPAKIEGYPVTAIANEAFTPEYQDNATTEWLDLDGYKSPEQVPYVVKEIIVPDSVTKLGNLAFHNCGAEKIVLPDNIQDFGSLDDNCDYYGTFSGCYKLKEINIPKSLKVIGVCTFEECSSLEKIVLPDTVEYIGEGAFEECINLKEITLSKNLKEIGKGAFVDCGLQDIIVPGSTKKIGENAFECCGNMKSIVLNEGIEEIGIKAFSRCNMLTEVTIPGSVMTFNPRILPSDQYDPKLEKLVLSEGVRMIQEGDFGDNLKTVYIPESVTVIKNEGSSRLTVVTPKGSYAATYYKSLAYPPAVIEQ